MLLVLRDGLLRETAVGVPTRDAKKFPVVNGDKFQFTQLDEVRYPIDNVIGLLRAGDGDLVADRLYVGWGVAVVTGEAGQSDEEQLRVSSHTRVLVQTEHLALDNAVPHRYLPLHRK